MMQLIHHDRNDVGGPGTCVPGKDQLVYCKGVYGLGNATGDGRFSTHIDGFIMDRCRLKQQQYLICSTQSFQCFFVG
jgi:hypothetical protein